MLLKAILGVVAATLFLAGGYATAAEVEVIQQSKKFDKKKVTIKKGDSIKFTNNDAVAHNIHSRSGKDKFDLGVQKPGTSSTRTFATTGKFKIRCAIHPKMKVEVKVE